MHYNIAAILILVQLGTVLPALGQENLDAAIVELSERIAENTDRDAVSIVRSLVTQSSEEQPYKTNILVVDPPPIEVDAAAVQNAGIRVTHDLQKALGGNNSQIVRLFRETIELPAFIRSLLKLPVENAILLPGEEAESEVPLNEPDEEVKSGLIGETEASNLPFVRKTMEGPIEVNRRQTDPLLDIPNFRTNILSAMRSEIHNVNREELRVWNGRRVTATRIEDDPYADAVIVTGNNQLCSGTLVSPTKVVYSAHCFCMGATKEVRFGTSLLNSFQLALVNIQQSKSMLNCETWAKNINKGDVAILTLSEPVNNVPLRRIASMEMVLGAAAIRAAGVGRREDGGVGEKFVVDIVIATHDCIGPKENDLLITLGSLAPFVRVTYEQLFGCAPGIELVAAGANKDTAPGDSGGGSYILGPDAKLYLASITSRAVDLKGRSGPGGVYVLAGVEPVREFLIANGVPETVFME